ncbi:hypothetical protein CVT26_010598 [Gymnopilus dilepis]|uniref:Uncharacterized protein n=1 Tax=Gymnopilus dilepis TaxID=231916 RepID=A0A409VZE6_9AGAR|nr:hypothetical protein CVT26_010598 [Gymnopilus dilepis]
MEGWHVRASASCSPQPSGRPPSAQRPPGQTEPPAVAAAAAAAAAPPPPPPPPPPPVSDAPPCPAAALPSTPRLKDQQSRQYSTLQHQCQHQHRRLPIHPTHHHHYHRNAHQRRPAHPHSSSRSTCAERGAAQRSASPMCSSLSLHHSNIIQLGLLALTTSDLGEITAGVGPGAEIGGAWRARRVSVECWSLPVREGRGGR